MRRARIGDWQRRLSSKKNDWVSKLERFSFEGVPSLGAGEFLIQAPLTVICGPNGVGKTTLLRALWATLDPDGATATPMVRRKLASGSALADVSINGAKETAEVEFGAASYRAVRRITAAVIHIDSATEATVNQREFCGFESVEEITNGVGSRELSANQVADINYLLSRDYRSIALYEVEMNGMVPFFEVSYGDDRYDSRTMGSGEAAAFHIWWALERVEKSSFVLIEEPEAFLSHKCQQAIAEYIVVVTNKKRLCTIISSHSSALITSVPKECVKFISRGQKGMQIVNDYPPPVLLKSIGVDAVLSAILIVEDSAGQAFCKSLLERFDSVLSRKVAIEIAGSEGEITNALRATRAISANIKFVGVYDGDMVGKVPEDLSEDACLLPGQQPLEKTFKELVSNDPTLFEEITGKGDIQAILSNLEGKDSHDWYEEMTKELGLNKSQFFLLAFSGWINKSENRESASATYKAICRLVGVDLSD